MGAVAYTWWHSAALGECEPPIVNGIQRSVNRKVQGSNPCSGAKTHASTNMLPAPPHDPHAAAMRRIRVN
jgi:hypothetical protein